jgi:hypothetical protein
MRHSDSSICKSSMHIHMPLLFCWTQSYGKLHEYDHNIKIYIKQDICTPFIRKYLSFLTFYVNFDHSSYLKKLSYKK